MKLVPASKEFQSDRLAFSKPLAHTHGRRLLLTSENEIHLREPHQRWGLEVEKTIIFRWQSGMPEIHFSPLDRYTEQRLFFWFMHIVMPFYLSLEENAQILHGSGVEVTGGAIVFIAPTHGGKSTLARSFYDQGYRWIADDKIAIYLRNGEYFAAPSLPFSRPFRENETLGEPIDRFVDKSVPLKAIFRLEKANKASDLSVKSLTGVDRYKSLLPSHVFGFPSEAVARFQWLARLADHVPVFELARPWGLNRLGKVCEVVEETCASLNTGGANVLYSKEGYAASMLRSA